MKLRSKLFLGSSALVTVALAGLLLAIFSVLQLTQSKNQAMDQHLRIIEASMGMHQELSKQVILLLAEELDREALKRSDQRFKVWLGKAAQIAKDQHEQIAIRQVAQAYDHVDGLLAKPLTVRRSILSNDGFGNAVEDLRDQIYNVQLHYIQAVEQEEERGQQRAWLVTTLLAATGLAVLVIGYITAHTIAQRFGRPIESLARAADQIGKGDFEVVLPVTTVAEMSALSQRFGLMAEALRQFKNSDVEALQAEQQQLQGVLDSINDGLLIVDCSGRIEHANPVAQRQLGWNTIQLAQPLTNALSHSGLSEQLQQVLRGDNSEFDPTDLEVNIDGEKRLLAYNLSAINLDDGRILGAVMVLRDVTEQRAFDQVRSEFVLRASHELRTPVTGMLMAFSLLREGMQAPSSARENDLFNTVEEEMNRLLRLINDLLNVSRYQHGLQSVERSACDLEPLLQRARQRFVSQAKEQQVSINCEINGLLPLIQIDPVQIERVLDNLIANALRHSHYGGTIRLRARLFAERLVVTVEDNGEGIPFQQQSRIFEPFVQVSHRKGGAGLGLALCKEIVQLHGGHIGVHSRTGQGSQFYFALPV